MQLTNLLNLDFLSRGGTDSICELPVDQIFPNRFQPRTDFDSTELLALAKSISQLGVLQPAAVRRTDDGYELVCGERRLRAARLCGLPTLPCVVVELSDSGAAAAALAENLQRRDLNCFEQAESFRRLIDEFGMTQKQLAVTLGISQPAVANKLRLLRLDPQLRAAIVRAGLSERHARALLSADEDARRRLLAETLEKELTAEGLEQLIADEQKKKRVEQSYRRRARSVGDVRLFFNTVERAVSIMKMAGVSAETEKRQQEGCIEYVIKIFS